MKQEIFPKNHSHQVKSGTFSIAPRALSVALLLFITQTLSAQTGTWTALTNLAPYENMGVCLLMTDGTVICHDTNGTGEGTGWEKLTPDIHGSYVNGTWSTIASNAYDRLFFSSQVLPSGKVYVAGGEYGAGTNEGEVYDPATNAWTTCGAIPNGWKIYDGNSELLYTGNILEGPQIGSSSSYNILQWSPTTLNYTTEANAPLNHDEAQWLKLPDSTVLYIGISSTSSNRFLPKTNTWINDGTVPVNIWDALSEAGAGFMLPNGKAIFFGATQHNTIYTPTGHPTAGTFTAAADFPTINGSPMGQSDASAAMMVNGKILCAVSPIYNGHNEFGPPVYFVEYDYTTNSFTQVKKTIPGVGGDSIPVIGSFQTQMLDLPDGNVLVSISQDFKFSTHYFIYTPGSAAIPQGKPTINSVYESSCGIYKATGKLFNGISEGAAYGDDWQCSTNYPIIRLSNGTNVYYATTSLWNRVGAVATDSLEDTTQFVLPAALLAGTYSLVVVANGFASNPTMFTYAPLVITASVTANVACNGESNGNATSTTTGGDAPYTYKWSNGTSTVSASNPTGTVLSAGTYTLTVTDNVGCTATSKVTVTQPNVLAITIASHTNASCSTGGTATANAATGGASPYTYSWSPSGGTNLTASGLTAGSYTITVTDNHGCTGTTSVTISTASSIRDSLASISYPLCNGGTGAATVGVKDGTAPYTYTWSPNSNTTATATGLTATTYTVIINDKNNCPSTLTFTVTQPTAIVVNATVTANVNCNGGSTGSGSSAPTGGTSPYTYAWSGGGTNATKTGLSAGTFTITVTDKNGCTASSTISISQPTELTVTATATTNVSCNGGSGGIVSATPGGGISPYTYAWSGGGTNSTKTGLSAATYTITVTDNHGCTATASATVTQPTSLSANVSITANVSCHAGNNGSASSSPSGGTSPYTYAWSGGGTNSTKTGLSATTYTITVTDKNGCTATGSVTITQPVALTVTANTTANAGCTTLGSVSSTPAGGTNPYTYLWTGGSTSSTESGLTAGNYTITVTDKNGCTATASAVITQAPTVSVTASVTTNVNCNGGSGGSVSSTPIGGTSPYTYAWSGGGTNSTKTGLTAGNYTITVTDNKGCTSTASATVTQPAVLSVTAIATANVSCNGGNNGSVSSTPIGGTSPYTYVWSGGGTNSTKSGLSIGTYTITITDKHGCTATASATISQPTQLTVSANTTTNAGCSTLGSVSSTPAGGTSPYTYLWTGGSTNSTETGLTGGTYTITVTDNNGCTATASTVITQSPAVSVTASVTANVLCNGNNTGNLSSTASAGTSPYTYLWTGGSTNSTETGLSAGTYTITVTDNKGCTATASATISQPSLLTVTAITTANIKCNGENNGTISTTVAGGIGSYTYLWTPTGATTATFTGASAGCYTVTVTDNNGCTATATSCVTQPLSLGVLSGVTAFVSCNGGNNGSVTSSASGGTSPYAYLWTGGSTKATETGLSAGTYTITVTDKNGCTATASSTITQPNALTAASSVVTNVGCNGGNNGSLTVTPAGGTSPYTYKWTGGGTNQNLSGLTAGTYTITLTDNNGCIITSSEAITQPTVLALTSGSTTAAIGNCNGSAWAIASGGTSPYTYKWTGGQTTDSITNQCKGNYCCTITDHNGCIDSICVDIVTGIEQISNASLINIYPDPNTGLFTITGLLHGQVIEIFNYVGQKISSAVADNETMHFNISAYANGVYLIRIQTIDGTFVTQKKMVKTY